MFNPLAAQWTSINPHNQIIHHNITLNPTSNFSVLTLNISFTYVLESRVSGQCFFTGIYKIISVNFLSKGWTERPSDSISPKNVWRKQQKFNQKYLRNNRCWLPHQLDFRFWLDPPQFIGVLCKIFDFIVEWCPAEGIKVPIRRCRCLYIVIHHFWLINHFGKDLHFNRNCVNWEAFSDQQLRKYSLWSQKECILEIATVSKMQAWPQILMLNTKSLF